MNKQILTAVVVIIIVLLSGLAVSRKGDAVAVTPTDEDSLDTDYVSPLEDMIHVFDPVDETTVYSPIDVFGEARGNWFFEGTFPVRLYDGEGDLLAEGLATTPEDWMTEDFIPFEASLSYQEPPKTETGTLVIMRDNPSGDPANDMQIVIPIQFDMATSYSIP